ncbi:hypothetical protein ACPA9J_24930 [Pseudomonas aeruginosa]
MAKPVRRSSGSGLHLHVSLTDAAGNNPVRQRGPGRDPAAAPGHRWNEGVPAGVFGAVLSERQLVPPLPGEQLPQPLAPTWGINNRTVSLRVPGGPASSRPVEHRICGADANPTWRRRRCSRRCAWGSRATRPRCADHRQQATLQATQALPSDWLTSCARWRARPGRAEALGEDFLKIYLAIKQAEYRAFMGEVGEQDWRWYLNQA